MQCPNCGGDANIGNSFDINTWKCEQCKRTERIEAKIDSLIKLVEKLVNSRILG